MPLSFLNPLFLWGLSLTSIPILIHLLQRRRQRIIRWGAMDFLLLSLKKRSRRLRVEQLLLLLVRCLVIALVVLAVSRPTIRPGALPTLASESHVHAILVLDNSYSMRYRPQGAEGDTLLDRAKKRAEEIVRTGLRQGDAVSLVLAGEPAQAAIRKPTLDLESVVRQVRAIRPSATGTSYAHAAQLCSDIIAESRATTPGNPEVYFITDSQANAWRQASRAAAWDQLSKTHKARLNLMAVNEGAPDNIAVADASLARGLTTSRTAAQIRARIGNFSARPARGVLATLEVDGRPAASTRVDIEAGAETAAIFTHVFEKGGVHTAAVRLPRDRLALDDTGYLSVLVRDAVKVLILNGRPDPMDRRDAALFLAVAMKPPAGIGTEADAVEPVVRSASALRTADLKDFQVVVLSNVAAVGDEDQKILAQYLQDGGGVLVFTGDQSNVALYNRDLFDKPPHLLPARLTPPAGTLPPAHLDHTSFEHPALQRFKNAADVQLGTAEIRRYVPLTPREKDASVRVMARFASGQPAMVEKRFGLGKLILVPFAPDLESSDLPIRPAFLPLIHQLVAYLAEGHEGTRNFKVGEPLVKPVPLAEANRRVVVTAPDGSRAQVRPVVSDRGSSVTFNKTPDPGFYTVSVEGGATRDTMAANLVTTESDLRQLNQESLAQLMPGVQWNWIRPSESTESAIRRSRLGIELWRICLFAAMALMLVECALAQLFGRRA